jgi:hypothetical protein
MKRAHGSHPSTVGSPRTLTRPNSKRPRQCSKSCHDVAPYRCVSFQNGFTGASVSLVKGSDEAEGSQVCCSESPEAGPPRRRKIDVGQPAHHHPAGHDPYRSHRNHPHPSRRGPHRRLPRLPHDTHTRSFARHVRRGLAAWDRADTYAGGSRWRVDVASRQRFATIDDRRLVSFLASILLVLHGKRVGLSDRCLRSPITPVIASQEGAVGVAGWHADMCGCSAHA